MRVGIVSYDFEPPIGGLGIVARQYRDDLAAQGVETVVISPSQGADESVAALARARYRKSGGCPLFSCLLSFRLRRIVRSRHLDLLLVHAGSGGVFLLRRPLCPLVVMAHHTYIDEVHTLFRSRPLLRLWKRWMAFLERRTYAYADAVLAVSNDTAETLREQYGVPRDRLAVLENPVSDRFLQHTVPSSPDLPTTILAVGRLEPRKGTDVLLRAFASLRTEFPTLRLVLAGANVMGDAFHTLLSALSLQSSVCVLGHIPEDQRIQCMQEAALIVVPSLLEGFGLIAAEAMAMGKLVVASSSKGLRSVLRDGETGLLIPPGDDRALAAQLRRALRDPELRERLGRAAAVDAHRRFDRRTQSAVLLSHLQRVLLPSSE